VDTAFLRDLPLDGRARGRLENCAQRFGLTIEAAAVSAREPGRCPMGDQVLQRLRIKERQIARQHQPGLVRMRLQCGLDAADRPRLGVASAIVG